MYHSLILSEPESTPAPAIPLKMLAPAPVIQVQNVHNLVNQKRHFWLDQEINLQDIRTHEK